MTWLKVSSVAKYPVRYIVYKFLEVPTLPAPSGDDILGPDDAINILEELLEAQNQSRFLGLKLNVPEHVVEAIHTKYHDPKERLYNVLVQYLNTTQMEPTWRTIVDALRSPAVNLPQLAKKVEAAHFPNRTSIRPEPRKASNGIYNCLNVPLIAKCTCIFLNCAVIQPVPKNDSNISSQTISSDDTGESIIGLLLYLPGHADCASCIHALYMHA